MLLCLVFLGAIRTPAQPYSLWDDSVVPSIAAAADPGAVELGVKFRSSLNVWITGIRFYKGEGNATPHVGHLWAADGTLLATVNFENETASGWQTQSLPAPVPILANTTYVVSYHAPNGRYAADLGYFASTGVDAPPLRALTNGEAGGNGVYAYGPAGTFPSQTFNAANYWVDVVAMPQDQTPPIVTCPPDVVLLCDDCTADPARTGQPTVTDESSYTLDYSDAITLQGCPLVRERTWRATDAAGNTATCVQTITCVPAALVTDSSGCIFDHDPATEQQDFRLIYLQDPQNWPCSRLVACNPGQFLYHVFYTGRPGQDVGLDLTLPYPFVTQGANPIHAYDGVTVAADDGRLCLDPDGAFFVSARQVTLEDYGVEPQPFVTVPVHLTVPASGIVHLAMHLDFGLKGSTGYSKNLNDDAVDCDTSALVRVPNHANFSFSVAGAQSGDTAIQSMNAFKRIPGVAGLVISQTTLDPIPNALVTLRDTAQSSLGAAVTDADGFYAIAYKHKGREATFSLGVETPPPSDYTGVQAVRLKANGTVQVDFLVP